MEKRSQKKSAAAVPMFSGDLSFMGCPRVNPVTEEVPHGGIIILGVPFDMATSNRPGARFGPRAIRTASKMLSWQKLYPWEEDIYGAEGSADKVFDGGDVDIDFGRVASVITEIEKNITAIVKNGKPLTLGGDHFITYPVLRGLNQEKKPALIHFDAHYDMWDDEEDRIDHGTGFTQALREKIIDTDRSLQIGIRTHREKDWGISAIDAFAADRLSAEEIAGMIRRKVDSGPAYLTFDIDVLDPAYAPGTGTPVSGGFTVIKVLDILRRLQGIDWVGADLVEVSPPYDHGEITALAGATIAGYLGHLLIAEKG